MMKIKIICLCIILLTHNISFAKTKILNLHNYDQLQKYVLDEADAGSLVLFDVDSVLLWYTKDYALNFSERLELYEEVIKGKSKREIHLIFSDFFRKAKVEFTDARMSQLLVELKRRNIATTALTAYWTGQYGTIEKMQALRFGQFEQLGISFQQTTPFKTDREYPAFLQNPSDPNEEGRTPAITSGVIFSAKQDKGSVLQKVLEDEGASRWQKIIFIDDRTTNITNMKRACDEMGIDAVLIQYHAKSLREIPKLNQAQEKARFDILAKEHIWLNNDELKQRKHER